MPRTGDALAQSISADIPTSCSDASTQSSADFDPLNNAESIDVLCAFSAIAPSSTPLGLVWQRAFEAGAQASQVNAADDLVIPPHVNVSIQTPLAEPPLLAVQMTDTTHLDWADDVESLFAQPPPPHQPRDLSSLPSSSPCPFASLQHWSKCQGSQSHCQRPFNSEFPYPHPKYNYCTSPRYPKIQNPKFKPVISHQASCLKWESDPQLFDLSHSLKALGWIRAH